MATTRHARSEPSGLNSDPEEVLADTQRRPKRLLKRNINPAIYLDLEAIAAKQQSMPGPSPEKVVHMDEMHLLELDTEYPSQCSEAEREKIFFDRILPLLVLRVQEDVSLVQPRLKSIELAPNPWISLFEKADLDIVGAVKEYNLDSSKHLTLLNLHLVLNRAAATCRAEESGSQSPLAKLINGEKTTTLDIRWLQLVVPELYGRLSRHIHEYKNGFDLAEQLPLDSAIGFEAFGL